MQKLRLFSVLAICLMMPVLFAGCATTVNFQVMRPPALNTLGIKRLAVMPFSTTAATSLQRQAAAYLMNESLTRIQAANHFTLVNAQEIERVRTAGGNIEELADALFSGQVVSASVQDRSEQHSYEDDDGNTITYTVYTREARVAYNYGITRTRDGSMTGPISKSFSSTDSSRDYAMLKTGEAMIQLLIQRNMAGLHRDVAPYMATERRSFMKETSRDKIVKQRAKDADALVKAGSYKSAQNAFYGIYQDTGSFAAAYNTALLIEVQGDLEGAASFMRQVHMETGNQKAAAEIARLQRALDDAGILAAYSANTSQRDKVIAQVIEALLSKLPDNARIALVNNSQNETELAESIVNSIIDGFIARHIPVIDRNNRALAEMERNYQYSGNVSDEEMVSIGHEAGINTFILVAVTGSGGTRRLSVRALDVERSTIVYQSPQTDSMNL